MRQLLFILALVSATSPVCNAQKSLFAEAGAGVSFVTIKHGGSSYTARTTPHISLTAHLPLSQVLALETGLGYAEKGFKVYSVFDNDDGKFKTTDVYHVTLRYRYIDIPLLLSIRIMKHKQSQLWLAIGMNYGFLLQARQEVTDDIYQGDTYVSTNSYAHNLSIGLVSSQQGAGYRELYMFNPAVKLGIRYLWRGRYILGVYYDMNLYDMLTVNDNDYFLRLQYAALSVGYRF